MSIFQKPRRRILKGLDFCILLDDAVKMEKCWKNMAAYFLHILCEMI
jgi:hypothetical protein